MYILAGVGLVMVIALFAVFSSGNAPTSQAVASISPSAYQSNYVEANARHLLLDVRTPEEFASGHIPGAVNIPVESLQSRLSEISSDQDIVVYCRSGNRSAQASQILAQAGYSAIYDLGGIINWSAQGYPVQS